jgi:predicted XRE-type DNA-binding protein
MSTKTDFIEGSGNVFADLGVKNADEELAKAELAYAIRCYIRARHLNQEQAASLLGTDQAKVSAIMNGKVSGYTYDRLLRFLVRLDCNVRVTISAAQPDASGRVMVEMA